MKANTKIAILSVIVIAMALGTYYYLTMTKSAVSTPSSVTPVVQPVVPAGNTSDSQLDQDISTVDSNLKSLDSQSTSVDAAINQKQVDPSQ